jgi:hypothetical protein
MSLQRSEIRNQKVETGDRKLDIAHCQARGQPGESERTESCLLSAAGLLRMTDFSLCEVNDAVAG